jgi:hypothetical protein
VVRAAAVLAVLGALGVYYGVSEELPELSQWGNVAFLAFCLMPATFVLVWLALPLRTSGIRALGIAALTLASATVVLEQLDLAIAANFMKLAAAVAVGWWFLSFFEALSWVLLVVLLIVPIDAFSVAMGPTKVIVEEHEEVFNALSVTFPIPGPEAGAQLGLPDILFFALFLGAADRFNLRIGWTWLVMTLSFGATLALAVAFDVSGLPALPLLSLAFVLVNSDLLWRAYRERSATPSK